MKINEAQAVYYGRVQTSEWNFYIAATDKGICFVSAQNGTIDEVESWVKKHRPNAVLKKDADKLSVYAEQLVTYLNGKGKSIDLPIDVAGTPFQKAVWTALNNIPYGETKTYTEIAEYIGRPNAVRAVGTAIGANPVLMVIPCHRVLSKNGKMSGFRGGITMKENLLKLEGEGK